jgi:hypothetical protein
MTADPLEPFDVYNEGFDPAYSGIGIVATIPVEGAAMTIGGHHARVLAWCVTNDAQVLAIVQAGRTPPVVVNPRSRRVRGDR